MGRKRKRWRDIDDPDVIFGRETSVARESKSSNPVYDNFRRHIDEHIQGETRAFHELRSTAEQGLEASALVGLPPRKKLSFRSNSDSALATVVPTPASTTLATVSSRAPARGTLLVVGLIFSAIGFLLQQAWQQGQPLNRLIKVASEVKSRPPIARTKSSATPDCLPEKPIIRHAMGGPAAIPAQQTSPIPEKPSVEPETPVKPARGALAAATEQVKADPPSTPDHSLKGITLRTSELRKGPGPAFEILDSLPRGYLVEAILTTDRQWLRLKAGGFLPSTAVQLQDEGSSAVIQDLWVGARVANIREFPAVSAPILRKAEVGSELKVQTFSREWMQVLPAGFVFRKLLVEQKPQALKLPAFMRVTVERAEIHSGPGPQFPVLGLYFHNHKVEVQEIQAGWLRIGVDQYIRAGEMEASVQQNSSNKM